MKVKLMKKKIISMLGTGTSMKETLKFEQKLPVWKECSRIHEEEQIRQSIQDQHINGKLI